MQRAVFKSKITLEKIEESKMFLNNRSYEITISPPPCEFDRYTNIETYDKYFKIWFYKFMLQLKRLDKVAKEYWLVPEVGKQGIFHYHGIIIFKDIARYLIYLHRNLGQVKIYDYRELWTEYCEKNMMVMRSYCKSLKIPYRITNKIAKTVSEEEAMIIEKKRQENYDKYYKKL